MNTIISAVVGALAASAVLVAGVNAVQGDQTPVADSKLYTYADQ